ncbi:hypothetical protein D3C83_130280 [compost metagenome]
MLSSALSLMRSTVSRGMSSNLSREANAARSRVAFASSGAWEVLMRSDVLSGCLAKKSPP